MLEWVASRAVVIALAVLGGVVSLVASALHSRGLVGEEKARFLSHLGYGFMWASIVLFIVAGFRAGWE